MGQGTQDDLPVDGKSEGKQGCQPQPGAKRAYGIIPDHPHASCI